MKLLITNKANVKLKTFVNLVDSEISGMAKSEITKEKDIIITDFMIFEQTVSGASTIISDESQAKFLNEMMKKNIDPSVWNVWWHSHCDMGVFWSKTDNDTIEQHNCQSYLISLVVNKSMDYKARLDIFPKDLSPFGQKTFCTFDIDKVEVIKDKNEQKIAKQYEKELAVIEKEFDHKMSLLEKKYNIADDKKITTLCQTEIKKKIKKIPVTVGETYYLPIGKTKKWSWVEEKPKTFWPDTFGNDLFNKQAPIGFHY